MSKTVKLTNRTAWELISRICTLKITKDDTAPHVAIFRARTGRDGLAITCENDWYDHNGRIKLTIHDALCGRSIIRYYHPDTLERDYASEDAEKEAEREEMRREWVQSVGLEKAIKMVERYWDGEG